MSVSRKTKVAVLGATSHIAKGLIHNFCNLPVKYDVHLFARSPERIHHFLESIDRRDKASVYGIEAFCQGAYDTVINCVGIGNPAVLKSSGPAIFRLTERFDNLILDYLDRNPTTRYINFSSGAIYGKEFPVPASDTTSAVVMVNNIAPEDYYAIAKIHSEAKHRAHGAFNIVDLRVFAYFSRFIDIQAHYFMTELISCVRAGREFTTTSSDITRDFIHPQDLFALVEKCIEAGTINDVFDVYSLKPVTKFELLDYFTRTYGLKYIVEDEYKTSSATGNKSNYYSVNRRAAHIGYAPTRTSFEAITEESHYLLMP